MDTSGVVYTLFTRILDGIARLNQSDAVILEKVATHDKFIERHDKAIDRHERQLAQVGHVRR